MILGSWTIRSNRKVLPSGDTPRCGGTARSERTRARPLPREKKKVEWTAGALLSRFQAGLCGSSPNDILTWISGAAV